MATAAKDAASQFKAVPMIRLPQNIETSELGWPLTICLWIAIGLNGLTAILLLIMALLSETEGSSLAAILAIFAPGIRLVGVIGILRCQRWGFYVFCFFVAVPIFFALLVNGIGWLVSDIEGWLELCLNIIPSLLIFFLTLGKFNELE